MTEYDNFFGMLTMKIAKTDNLDICMQATVIRSRGIISQSKNDLGHPMAIG